MGLRKKGDTPGLREVVQREYSRDLPGLAAQLSDIEPGVRRRAARDLAADPEAVRVLGARLPLEPDASVRDALLTALCQHPGPAAARQLLPLVDSDDTALRNAAVDALATMADHITAEIAALLASPLPLTRELAVNLLREVSHPSASARIHDILAGEAEANVVAAALDVLAEIGTPADAPAVRAVLERFVDVPFIRFAAELVLLRIETA